VALLGGSAQGKSSDGSARTVVLSILKRLFLFVPFPVLLIAATLMSADTLPFWSITPLQVLAATMGTLFWWLG